MEQIHVETSNPSQNLQDPSKLLSNDSTCAQMSSDQPNDMISDQGLSALHSKQPVDVKLQAKGTLQNISSLTDATVTTMGDSALQLPSQNISQPGTLNTIENLTSYEKAGEEGLQEPDKLSNETPAMKLIRLSESPTQTALSKKTSEPETEPQSQDIAGAEPEVKENLVKDSMEGQGAIESGVRVSDQSSALSSQQENIKTENTRQVQIESPNSKKQLERVTSLENLANQTKQADNDPGTTTPAQIRFDTDHSESRSFGTPNQQFTSDQHDSEGYISRNRAGSSRNESGLSSTEDSKVQEPPKKEPAAVAKPKISLADFHKVAVLGRGSYGEVSLVKKISNNKLYALKAIDKYFMKKEHKEHQVYVEKEVLMKSNHPNIIKFYSSFQDKKKLYFVLEYVGGGEFSDYLRAQRKLRKEEIAFFTAEVINILEYLHSNNIAHRDIKPENLLLTIDGHLKCIDFGTAQFMTEAKTHKEEPQPTDQPQNSEAQQGPARKESSDFLSHRKTFVGTAQYVSPEMLEHSECDTAADLWALGCMVYVMAVGRYPFEESNEFLIFQKIQNIDISYPLDMDPQIKDLIERLLKKEPHERLGAGAKGSANDVTALKAHPLFTGIDFAKLHKAKAPMAEIVSPHRQRDQFATFPSPIEDPIQKLVPNRKHFLSEDLQTLEEKTGKTPAPSTSTAEVKERIILSGLVLKKCGWLFFRPRQLVLNSKPRLVYYDPETNQLKGEIPLEPGTFAELESKQKWIIHTPKKKYFFKEMEHSAEKWVETINQIAAQLNQKKV